MNVGVGWIIAVLAFAGCSTLAPRPPSPRLALYAAHAGAPVPSFRSLGRFDNWEPLGDDVLAVWTRPNQAWLLELYGPCDGLEYSVAIGVTDHAGQVEAGLDRVLVSHPSPVQAPCTIRTIRPLDVSAIKQAEHAAGAAKQPAPGDH
jgi:hypothetical protein